MRKFHDPAPKPHKRIMTANLTDKVPLRIDERTTIFIRKGDDPEEARKNYILRIEISLIRNPKS